MTQSSSLPMVDLVNGQAVVSSLQVAEHFEKRHDHVLRDIKALIDAASECAPNFGATSCALNFEPTSISVPMPNGGSRTETAYHMNRDGFSLLAMGFTGRKALQWKIKYIQAFNAMEQMIRDGRTEAVDAGERAIQDYETLMRSMVRRQEQLDMFQDDLFRASHDLTRRLDMVEKYAHIDLRELFKRDERIRLLERRLEGLERFRGVVESSLLPPVPVASLVHPDGGLARVLVTGGRLYLYATDFLKLTGRRIDGSHRQTLTIHGLFRYAQRFNVAKLGEEYNVDPRVVLVAMGLKETLEYLLFLDWTCAMSRIRDLDPDFFRWFSQASSERLPELTDCWLNRVQKSDDAQAQESESVQE